MRNILINALVNSLHCSVVLFGIGIFIWALFVALLAIWGLLVHTNLHWIFIASCLAIFTRSVYEQLTKKPK